jgi:basic amino acid/polyamine antiporter, APA family
VQSASRQARLQPVLGISATTALVVSNVIGVGIFTTPAVIAGLVPNSSAVLILWIAGGLLAFCGAVTYSELAKLCPRSGGEYNYLSHAYGPLAGFLSGWISLIAGFSGAIAASAIALVSYLSRYFPHATSADSVADFSILSANVSISRQALWASAIILLFAGIHICGLGPGKLAQKALTFLVLLLIGIFLVAGFYVAKTSLPGVLAPGSVFRLKDWWLALIPVMFTYSGWNAAAYVSEEVRGSGKQAGRAMQLGTAIVVLVYLALNQLYLVALPSAKIASSINVGDVAAQKLFGVGSGFITPILILALGGAISAMSLAGPRVYFAMARDGVFPGWLSAVNPRFKTPARAIAIQAAWSILLVLLGGFEQILMYTGFAIVLSAGVTVTALAVIRVQRGLPLRMIRDIAVPGVFAFVSLLMVVSAIQRAPARSLVGLLLIGVGVPVYFLFRRKQASPETSLASAMEAATIE